MNHLDLYAEGGYSQRAKDLVDLQEVSKELLDHICNATAVTIFKIFVTIATIVLAFFACISFQIEMAFVTTSFLVLCSLSAIIGAEKIVLLLPSPIFSLFISKKKK